MVSVLNRNDYMCVVDIKSAYRAVSIRAEHKKYMGFRWELDGRERLFVENRLCFGLRLGPCYFDELSMFVHDVLTFMHNVEVVNYLDDFIVIATSYESCLQGRKHVTDLLRFLGFHVSYSKITTPSKVTTFLGIEIDSEKMELRLPWVKVVKLRNLLETYKDKEKISKHNLESLGGLLSHCSHLVRGGKIFCRMIRIPAEMRRDLAWWDKFCISFNGISCINNEMFEFPMVSDSSMKGFGVYMGHDWAAGFWDESHVHVETECHHITPPPHLNCQIG